MAGKVYKKAESFRDEYIYKSGDQTVTHYCPGCGHGNIHKYIAEAIDELGIQDKMAVISPVGCSVFAYYYFDAGNVQVAHGRAPAVGTGLKRANPHGIVISYQGDGDLAAIGGNNILQAANRGEQMTVIFVNNSIYGMTGGQMAPTTLVGQKSTTSPYGRKIENEGYPIRMCEIISQLEAPVYVERCALYDTAQRNKTRKAIKKALKLQLEGKGFTFLEILASCPSGWKMSPVEANKWQKEHAAKYFPVKLFKDDSQDREPYHPEVKEYTKEEIVSAIDLTTEAPEQYPAETPDKYKNPTLKIAGFGGQGILMLGIVLSNVAMEQNFASSWLPSYGPEMRGGTANCSVCISDKQIGSPVVDKPSVLIAFNRPSLEKFEKTVQPGGLILYDNSLIDIEPTRDDIEVVPVPATQMADDLGTTRIANMVMVGAYIEKTKLLSKEAVVQTLPKAIKRKKLIPMNEDAIEKGMEYVRNL